MVNDKKEHMSAGELIERGGGINVLKGCHINIRTFCKERKMSTTWIDDLCDLIHPTNHKKSRIESELTQIDGESFVKIWLNDEEAEAVAECLHGDR